ncbi:CYFA0S03e03994g1_1 [Cyberlindnera fabianii]|uniref:CYFA0S03e03994g1_1 n=1 Tax=Cyberlindnera fabianii TaxID=36022 RepID=A0A061AQT6_CYBFA|nr:Protein MSN5 [Cyberlindnera fabianii]CDR39494.1 CYFA0S03e03994g1_1 [Cyberlindnera fabianii]
MDAEGAQQIVSALELIHSPKSSNQARQEAQQFLEQVKRQDESPLWGYELALPTQNAIVRHFGLTLLQNSINRHWTAYDEEKKLAIRKWIIDLATKLLDNDPHYLKEKLAFLWVSAAKRCWGSYLTADENTKAGYQELVQGWHTMDSDLLQLWMASPQTRDLVLSIFRTLFEDVYILDDPITSGRNSMLCSSCSNVLLPQSLIDQKYEPDANLKESKASKEGWFLIWQEFLNECIRNGDHSGVIKTLETLKTCLNWPTGTLITQSQILNTILSTLVIGNIKIKILSVNCLHILFTRSFSSPDDQDQITGTIFKPEGIQLLSRIYNEIQSDPDDIDDEIYSCCKKLTEAMVNLSEHLPNIDLKKSDINGYFKLILSSTASQSLTVSAISLNLWGYMLRETDKISMIEPFLFDLLEVAASKMENFAEYHEDHPAQKFLEVDFNSQADSYTFVSSYKKLIDDIVRLVICIRADEGLLWLNQRLESYFSSEIGNKAITSPELDYHREPFITIIAQLDIVTAAVKGVIRWKIWYGNADYNEKLDGLLQKVESLLEKLLAMDVKDPVVLKKFTQTYVQFAPLLKDNMTFRVIERLLTVATFESPPNASDDLAAAVKDLRTNCGTELNRLGFLMPENLKAILDELETVFQNLLPRLSNTEAVSFKAFLLVVSQRSSIENKEERFIRIVEPEIASWTDPDTVKGLSDLPWFMERLGIVKIAEYFESRGITADTDLLNTPMDEQGLRLKTELKDRWSALFPIRSTRLLIQYSIEKLPKDSQDFKNLLKLWKPRVTPIIPHILQLLYQIQAYHNPDNWKQLPAIVQSFARDTTIERFWQMGVSIQSRDEFMEESVKAMHTLRDFADSVGHIIRYTREYVFLSLATISQLDDTFYSVPDIADVFWRAATGENVGITLHSWKHMINYMLRPVIKNCPPNYVRTFMPQLLPQMFNTLDALLMSKWEKVYISGFQFDEDDAQLSEEMMEEHLLRQVTQVVIRLLVDCVGQYAYKTPLTDTQLEIRRVVFDNKEILGPFLRLICHVIMFKDSRCSYNAVLILRSILQDIMLKDDEVDKFLCDDLTKSLIHVLTDDLYREAQNETAYVFTTLYITMFTRGDYITSVLRSYFPNATDLDIQTLKLHLSQAKNLKEQRNVMLVFLHTVKQTDDDDEKMKRARNKQIEQIQRKKKTESDVLNDPFTENDALGTLFGDN